MSRSDSNLFTPASTPGSAWTPAVTRPVRANTRMSSPARHASSHSGFGGSGLDRSFFRAPMTSDDFSLLAKTLPEAGGMAAIIAFSAEIATRGYPSRNTCSRAPL